MLTNVGHWKDNADDSIVSSNIGALQSKIRTSDVAYWSHSGPLLEHETARLQKGSLGFDAGIYLTLHAGQEAYRISGYFSQRLYEYSVTYLSPTILIGRVLPEDSAVFDVVRTGDLAMLELMLEAGTVTVRDVDPEGRGLLNVSTD